MEKGTESMSQRGQHNAQLANPPPQERLAEFRQHKVPIATGKQKKKKDTMKKYLRGKE